MRLTRSRRARAPGRVRGLSIVELLVGIAVGLFVLAGATMVVSGQLSDNRRLMLETQVQQDLRAAADMIIRDLRRGGYWASAASNVWPTTAGAAPANPYPAIWTASGGGGGLEWMYSYSSASPTQPENNTLDASETFGYRLDSSSGTIQMQIGGAGWQALTDASVVKVTQFNVQVNPLNLTVPCAKACPGGGVACWPQQVVREVGIVIAAEAVHDDSVKRSVTSGVRLRNDGLTGSCPA
jgi:type IV pilus assembly protein PilW